MKDMTLVIGGCKSGKSGFALTLAEESGQNPIFMATCVPLDDEMKDRVKRHRAERSNRWYTVDVPEFLPEAVAEYGKKENVLLVDCMTLWITNLLLKFDNTDTVNDRVERLIRALETAPCPVILVSNEVGAGIVPGNRLARVFRDAAGIANQKFAAAANRVVWMVAGIPSVIKKTQ